MQGIAYAKQYVLDKSDNNKHDFKLTKIKNTDNLCTIKITSSDDNLIGEITIEKAIDSAFQNSSKLTNKQLHNCAILHIPKIYDTNNSQSLLPVLCYFAMSHARIWKCQNIIFACDFDESIATRIIEVLRLEPLNHCQTVTINNQSHTIFAQRIKYAIYNTYELCETIYKSFLQSEFINEILETFEAWLIEFFQDSWCTAIATRSISKEQYITSLYNMHQFVRHTTRLAARCVACSDDRELRNHYIYHLKGEINHEIIIESDLTGLGVDLDYILNAHVAHKATSKFIVLQESTIGYRQDPVMMLACPFIAEGLTANISHDFVDHLHATIQSWGIDNPETVSKFLTSHMHFDGGVDGHWLRVIMMTHKFIKTELQLQHYLNTMQLAMSGYAHGLNANIDDLELWRPAVTATESLAVPA